MKKMVLLMACSMQVLAISAQIKDTTYLGTPVAGSPGQYTFTPYTATLLIYNSQCQVVLDTSKVYNAGTYTQSGVTALDYYSNGLSWHTISKSWDASSNAYLNQSMITQTYYNNTRKLSTFLVQTWSNNNWRNSILSSDTYDGNGILTDSIYQVWDTLANNWVTQSHEVLYNNINGEPDSTILTTTTQTTSSATKTIYTYDMSTGFISVMIRQILVNGQWQNSNRTTNMYDNNGNLLTQIGEIYASQQWQLSARTTNTYDAASHVLTQAAEVYQLGQWIKTGPSAKYTYYSDGSLAEQYIENFINGVGYNAAKTEIHYAPPCTNNTMPVNLLNFGVEEQNAFAALSWQTSSETNTAFFDVQRSINGITFSTIGRVIAAGNGSAQKNYTYKDPDLDRTEFSKFYYRLAETDKDGTITYSKIVQLDLLINGSGVFVSPNPIEDILIIHSTNTTQNAIITISDIGGRQVYTTRQNLIAGGQVLLNTSSLNPGLYFITIWSQNNKQVIKVVKKH